MDSSWCFHQAYIFCRPKKPNDPIFHSEDEWMGYVVAHMRGTRHPEDAAPDEHAYLLSADYIGSTIRVRCLMDNYDPLSVDEAKVYQDFLVACLQGDTPHVLASFEQIRSLRAPALDPTQILGVIAAAKLNEELLRFAFEKGAVIDKNLALAFTKARRTRVGCGSEYMTELTARVQGICEEEGWAERPRRRVGGFQPGNRFDDIK